VMGQHARSESLFYYFRIEDRVTYVGVNTINRTHVYVGTRKRCRDCPQKAQCTRGHYRQVAVHVHEPARQRARERAKLPAFGRAQCHRRKVEALFAELKNQIGLRRVRLRRMKFVREQFYLAATAQNLKRLARYLKSRTLESAPIPIGARKRKRDTPPQGIASAQKSSTTSEFFDNHPCSRQLSVRPEAVPPGGDDHCKNFTKSSCHPNAWWPTVHAADLIRLWRKHQ